MISAKSASLLAGVLQQASLVLIIRFSKTQHEDNDVVYLTSVAVAASELFKLGLSYVLEVRSHSSNEEKSTTSLETKSDKAGIWKTTLKRMLNVINLEAAKLIIPALLYLVQNNLLFVALSNLSVPLYQVTNQGKLLTTAVTSRVLLKKEISALQYFSITLLGLGVAVIHLSEYYAKHSSISDHAQEEDAVRHQNQVLGLLAVLVSCFTSGFSAVYFELILKKQTSQTKQSLHVKNFQLALWSFLLAVCLAFSKDSKKIRENGLFQGFDCIVLLVIVAQGMTGFVVSLMLNYADAVLKGFAIAVAAILSTVISVTFFGTQVDASFLIGASMVLIAVKLYSYKGNKKIMPPRSTSSVNAEQNNSKNIV